jgi:hypothetical protein
MMTGIARKVITKDIASDNKTSNISRIGFYYLRKLDITGSVAICKLILAFCKNKF